MTKYFALAFYRLYAGAAPYAEGVVECGGRKIPYRVYLVSRLFPSWAGGQTAGNFVFVRSDIPEWDRGQLLRHELVHVCQFARHAPWFPLLYLWALLRYGYQNNPFEVEARQKAGGKL